MITSPLPDLLDLNVLFLTLDCCRFDSLATATAPTIRSIGPIRAATTYGTYTLPAHVSFFAGYLPTATTPKATEPLYSNELIQLWRLKSSRPRSTSQVGVIFDAQSAIHGYANAGFHTVGAGGVRWFLNPILRGYFDEFHFWGPEYDTPFTSPRHLTDFPLNHSDFLASRLVGHKRWLLFVNCPETHAPYDVGDDNLPAEALDLMKRASPMFAGKLLGGDRGVSSDDLKSLAPLQRDACSTVDQRLAALMSLLPRPFLAIICGDHGECFGEDGKWGHGFPHKKVTTVPLVCGIVH